MKEATLLQLLPRLLVDYFNSRFHEGSDVLFPLLLYHTLHFNSRFHEGSDEFTHLCRVGDSDFNSRFHEGSDLEYLNGLS